MSRRERQRRRARRRGHPVGRVLLLGSAVTVLLVVLAVVGVIGWVLAVASTAPSLDSLHPRLQGSPSAVYASDGQILGYIASDVVRTPVSERRIPMLLREATVAIEDRRFWSHGGVDYVGFVRAGIKDLFGQGGTQGGSTLTMQLVKNVYLPERISQHRNIRYKIIQAMLANELESRHSKNWILTQYLNDVPYGAVFGRNAIGVAAAARMFFDRPVGSLNLPQMALLAGLPQAPTDYNPFSQPTLARQRRAEVLKAMANSGYITAAQEQAANAAPLEVHANRLYETVRQPYVFDYIRQQLIKKLGLAAVDAGGLQVHTTINLADQLYAREALLAHEPGGVGAPAAGLEAINPANGQIVAMAQNSTYGTGPGETTVNYAADIQRQSGSSFKPFVLMTLIHDYDGDPNQTYYVSKELLPGWLPSAPTYKVQTAEHSYQGTINITKAMWLSDNTVFAQLGVDLGMTKVDAMAHAMGVTSPLFGYPAEAIGGLRIGVSPQQMADAYATMADGGVHHAPTILTTVKLPSGRTLNFGNPPGKRVFTDGEAYAGTKVLEDVLTVPGATGTAAYYGCPAAGKTGTTENLVDGWFVGYTPMLSTAVWVGYPKNEATPVGYGGTVAAPVWHDFMAHAGVGGCEQFPQPTTAWTGVPYHGPHSAGGPLADSGPSGGTGYYGAGNTGYVAPAPAGPTGTTGPAGKATPQGQTSAPGGNSGTGATKAGNTGGGGTTGGGAAGGGATGGGTAGGGAAGGGNTGGAATGGGNPSGQGAGTTSGGGSGL